MDTDLRLIAPIVIFDPINEEDTFSVPVKVVHISDQVSFDFSYMKKADEITPPVRKINFEMCNRFSQIQEFTGYIWETSYQKLVVKGRVIVPFLSKGSFIKDADLNYKLIVYSERNFLSLIPIPEFGSEKEKVEYIVRIYWNFFMWAKDNLYEYWNN